MIMSPTVLVLGAGASMPYGFPSGRELFFIIKKGLSFQSTEKWTLWGKLLALGIKAKQIMAFRSALIFADPISVDAFLEHRDEFTDVGKLSIALSLIPYEDEGRLFNVGRVKDVPESWYRYLMDKLDAIDCSEFNYNKLSIITFNYDRSLEHYLFTALRNRYGIKESECANAISAIPIIHVHGSLGVLPWQEGHFSRPYKKTEDLQEIIKASNEIVVMSEKEEDAAVFQRAFNLMNNADKIYFLGFGYHPTNLRRLKLGTLTRKTNKHGTSIGLGQAEFNSINHDWQIIFYRRNTGILDLFKNHVLP